MSYIMVKQRLTFLTLTVWQSLPVQHAGIVQKPHKYFKYLNVTGKKSTLKLVTLTNSCTYFIFNTCYSTYLSIHIYIYKNMY